jgi:hypothetical protein
MAFPDGLTNHEKQRLGADHAAARATSHGLKVQDVPLNNRTWLRLNGYLTAVFAYGDRKNASWTYRSIYLDSLSDAAFIVFADYDNTEPQFLVIPVDTYREADSGVSWEASEWRDRWDLIPA